MIPAAADVGAHPSAPQHSGSDAGERYKAKFRADVQGLRAVAIVLVVLYHVSGVLSGGFVGVDVFFVISGFLITGQLIRELDNEGRISFLAFYARRARRILPAATVVIAATVVASALLLAPLAAKRALTDAVSAVGFAANFHFAVEGADYFNAALAPSPLQHFWSLAVEEQFYVVWPLLMLSASLIWLRVRRGAGAAGAQPGSAPRSARRPAVVMIVAVLGGVTVLSLLQSVAQTPDSPSWAYYSIFSRAWELAVGGLIALGLPLVQRLDRRLAAALSWIGLACIAIAATAFGPTTLYPGDAALLPVAGAAAVIAGGSSASRRWSAEAILGTPPFQYVGDWSYSWYLWHWPFLILGAAVLGHSLTELEGFVVAGLSLLAAVLSFVLIERPIRRIRLIVRRPRLGLAAGAALAAAALVVVVASGSLVGPLVSNARAVRPALAAHSVLTPAQLRADLAAGVRTIKAPSNLTPPLATAANAKPVIVVNGCHLHEAALKSKPCVYGDTTSHTSVVLYGDSHAAAWFPALNIISKQQHWRLVDITKAGCPPAEVRIVSNGAAYRQCMQWRANAMSQIAALHPALIIAEWARFLEVPEAKPMAGVPTGHGSAWLDGVAAAFKFMHRNAQHVLFLSDGPTLNQVAPDCVSGHLSDVRPCLTARSVAVRQKTVKDQELALAKSAGISSADPTSWFCSPTKCAVIVGNILLYRDNAHMTPAWSDFIAPVLADTVVPVMTPKPSSAAGG